MFCPNCRSMMFLKGPVFQCVKCGCTQTPDGEVTHMPDSLKKETVVLENEEMTTLPIAKVECPSCKAHEAYWILRQTRASDEPETRIYTCKTCKHKWREY
jgi:transcription factor S